jgi:hypothetical protein
MEKRSTVLAVYAESLVFESSFGSAEVLTTHLSSDVTKRAHRFLRGTQLLSLQGMPRRAAQRSCPSVIRFSWTLINGKKASAGGSKMKRREFCLGTSAAAAWPHAVHEFPVGTERT